MLVNDKNSDRRSLIVLAVICAVLQLALAPNIGIANGRANFALIFAACIALGIGGSKGVVCGFVAGLFFDLSTTGPVGLMALELTVFSFLAGLQERNRLSDNPSVTLELFAAGTFVVSLVYNLAMVLAGNSVSIVDALFLRTLPTTLLTFLFFLPFLFFLSRASSPAGKMSKGTPRTPRFTPTRRHGGGGHYSTKGL